MSSVRVNHPSSQPARVHKRKSVTVGEIKHKLTNFGTALWGSKQALQDRLEKAEKISEIVHTKPINESWDLSEFNAIVSLLPREEEWAVKDVKFVYENLNTRFCAENVLTDENVSLINKIKSFYKCQFEIMPREKTDIVTADSLVDMMDKLARKRPAKWGKEEAELIIARFSMVHAIDGSHSSDEAIGKYRVFGDQLSQYYSLRPAFSVL